MLVVTCRCGGHPEYPDLTSLTDVVTRIGSFSISHDPVSTLQLHVDVVQAACSLS